MCKIAEKTFPGFQWRKGKTSLQTPPYKCKAGLDQKHLKALPKVLWENLKSWKVTRSWCAGLRACSIYSAVESIFENWQSLFK